MRTAGNPAHRASPARRTQAPKTGRHSFTDTEPSAPDAPSSASPRATYPYRRSRFARFAKATARATGHPLAFATAALIVIVWLITGPLFGFSDTWQLVINTGTTIVTFLMVFLIQNTQNREGAAVQLKLDELIRSVEGAHTALLDVEELTDEELETIIARYEALARAAREKLRRGVPDTGSPEVESSLDTTSVED